LEKSRFLEKEAEIGARGIDQSFEQSFDLALDGSPQ
jgi:hypothetical protein